MGITALQATGTELAASAAAQYKTAEYRGATVAARFSDPQAELAALHNGCGVYDLGFRAKISLTGSDRVRWLNGMVTNNVRDLAEGHGVYAFLLNPQGHILGDLYAYNRGESIVVDTDRSQVEKILATFDHYIIMDDVEVANLSEQITAIGVAGPKARAVLEAIGLNFPGLQPLQLHSLECDCDCGCLNCAIVRGDDATLDSYEIWLAPTHAKPLWDALVAAGATPVGFEAMELHRILAGIPLYGADIRERDLPQETEQMRALNFSKGCYIGQEIVERIRSRGAVHRTFRAFLAEPAALIACGAKIRENEKDIGEITSVALLQSASGETAVALGYVRRELGAPGREVIAGETRATVVEPPVDYDLLVKEGSAPLRTDH
jgi:folate-binding protein YgfZ